MLLNVTKVTTNTAIVSVKQLKLTIFFYCTKHLAYNNVQRFECKWSHCMNMDANFL